MYADVQRIRGEIEREECEKSEMTQEERTAYVSEFLREIYSHPISIFVKLTILFHMRVYSV